MNEQQDPIPTPADHVAWIPEDAVGPTVESGASHPTRKRDGRRRVMAAIAGSLFVGGVAGAAILGPLTAAAASPATTATPGSDTNQPGGRGGPGMGGPGGHVEAVSDTSVAAKAIGISEADLTTALQGGQTIAAVAKAHNVDVQKVIDAFVADGLSELAEQVKAGTLTQAQADAQKAAVTQRATDQVNGTMPVGHP